MIVILRAELAKILDRDWDRYQEVGKIWDQDWDWNSEFIFFRDRDWDWDSEHWYHETESLSLVGKSWEMIDTESLADLWNTEVVLFPEVVQKKCKKGSSNVTLKYHIIS